MYIARGKEVFGTPKHQVTKYNERIQRLCRDVVCAKSFMDLGKATITTVSDIK